MKTLNKIIFSLMIFLAFMIINSTFVSASTLDVHSFGGSSLKHGSNNYLFHFNKFYSIIYSQPGCQSPVFLQSILIASSQVIFLVITSNASCGAL